AQRAELALDGDGPALPAGPPEGSASRLAVAEGLPQLRELAVSLDRRLPAWLARAPVLERIERLTVRVRDGLGPLLEAIARRGGALRELVLVGRGAYGMLEEAGWRIVLRRERAPGPFSWVTARFRLGRGATLRRFAVGFDETMRAVPAGWPRELAFEVGKRLPLPAEDRELVASTLARFAQLAPPELPWSAEPPRAERPAGALDVYLRGPGLLDAARLPEVWRFVVDDLGERYDRYRAGKRDTLHALGAAPLETLAGALRSHRVQLVRDGHRGTLGLARGDHVPTTLELDLGARTPDAFIAWLARFAAAIGATMARADRPGRVPPPDQVVHALDPPFAWLMLFGPSHARVLPAAAVARACRVERAGRGILVVTAPSPAEATDARIAEVRAHLRAVFDAHLADHLGYDFAELAHAGLAATAAALDLPLVARGPMRVAFARGVAELEATLHQPLTAPQVRVSLLGAPSLWRPVLVLTPRYTIPIASADELRHVLAAAAAECARQGAAWLATHGEI
ncbi:MAG: hypothetical protein KIT31_14285, partial [Deltaproteobacteria bacterium]|nr:hypothetical protein [Deltaproteobacteria bacterium]